MGREGRRIVVTGTVQGVGFRPWVYRVAHETHVTGRVRNDSAGVTIDAFGPPATLSEFIGRMQASPPPAAAIDGFTVTDIPYEDTDDFVIVGSAASSVRRVSIPPDLATCAECLAELRDPLDRRFGYAFTNCTNCGPRYTITRDVPYDRAVTTMSGFEMCGLCRLEYESPRNRRFHAEPNACPVCGPSLLLTSALGEPVGLGVDPIRAAVDALRSGAVLAVKGLGGFHLACDASSSDAVVRLRDRKRRDEKPFAVMVASLEAADAIARLDDHARRLLTGAIHPIVLVPRRADACLAPEVAPHNPLVGVLLPYTPLHHLLMDAVERPLVMTSGNLSEEPLAFGNDEALERLRDIADVFLMHDRDITTPCDDSVIRTIAGGPTVLRRSRGYVPRSVTLPRPVAHPTLACGALLKNSFCLAHGDEAWFGPHVGDLDTLATHRFFEESVSRFERFLQLRPEVVAHDLHPQYHSTVYALRRPDVVTVGVQHHHAHVASAMAEHGLDGPVLGLAWDGTGLGTDGTAWGGELLLARLATFERLATFRPVALAGGDRAIHEVWRIALALLLDAFGDDAPIDRLELFRALPPRDVTVVRQMVARGINTPRAHGVGRFFDAFGAIGLARARSRYEGQVAMLWDHVVDPAEAAAYPFDVQHTMSPWIVDLRPTVITAVADLLDGRAPGIVSARFHNALVRVGVRLVELAAREHGRLPVVLTGGCFQNAHLTERLAAALAPIATVHLHREVPPGDGGIALGQVLVADAVVHGEPAR